MSGDHHHPHDHDHAHGDGHDPHAPVNESHGVSEESALLERALRELLIEKNIFTADALRRQIELTESRTPELGAKVVAHAWKNPAYKAQLLADAKPAMESFLGIDLNLTPELTVVENTPARHHLICCTLCSCYPRAVLGIPPAWYKNPEYRARVVREPRTVLAEFGTHLPPEVEIRVVDSTADMRYIVLPARPANTGHLTEDELVQLISRDSMIGVSVLTAPDQVEAK
ncbi:MAG: nthA [Betaproteobacteria bacterium]|nr:nthA [Betaproteobacteria bacterium]